MDEFERNCAFCAAAASRPGPFYDVPLFETESHIVLPSLGAFVEGWLLVISRGHLLNLRQSSPKQREDLSALVPSVSAALEGLYGPLLKFEHGPGTLGSPAGCSVDHAHLHLVPHSKSVRPAIEAESESSLGLTKVSDLFANFSVPAGHSYIYLEEPDGTRYLGAAEKVESQLVRRVLAQRLGRGSRFDWRDDLAIENAASTQAALAA